jgi:hypothetical protein
MKVQISNPKIQETQYGSYTPVFFEGSFRYDLYKSKLTGDEVIDSILSMGASDLSPVQTVHTYESRKKCHCCFAGYGHTVNLCLNSNNL